MATQAITIIVDKPRMEYGNFMHRWPEQMLWGKPPNYQEMGLLGPAEG